MRKEFGNTWTEFKKLLIFGAVFGGVVTAILAGIAISQGNTKDLAKLVPIGLLAFGLVIPVFVAPTLLFSIWIEEGTIYHMFCRRWLLSQGKVSDLAKLEVAVGAGAKFFFADGSKIRFIGADLLILQAMCLFIRELRPDFNGFVMGSRAAMILAAVRAFSPKDRAQDA